MIPNAERITQCVVPNMERISVVPNMERISVMIWGLMSSDVGLTYNGQTVIISVIPNMERISFIPDKEIICVTGLSKPM